MNLQKILLICICFIFGLVTNTVHAAINFTVTPLKYEIEVQPGESVTRAAQIKNNGTDTVTLTTATSDFQANGTDGTPSFVRYSELVHADQQLSSWIDIDTPSLTLAPGETKGFNFDIDVPTNATPGGHYGAVFFKNPSSEASSGAEIGINVDYAVILIVNVSGEVIVDIEIDDIIINNGGGGGGGGWGGGRSDEGRDSCPFGDLTRSNFDGKCIDNPFEDNDEEENDNESEGNESDEDEDENNGGEGLNGENNSNTALEGTVEDDDAPFPGNDNNGDSNTSNEGENSGSELEDFEVTFQLPINNNGNTHVQPSGKIKLIDEDGKEIKGVGKEVKMNEFGAVIGEEIVDYLPINDQGGKVLPKTKRNFDTTWKGFPYKTYDDRGNQVIQYWKPGEYYTNKNLADNRFMMPWERVCEKRKTKKVQAFIEVAYDDASGGEIQYNAADEFEIEYTEEYIGLNPYVVLPILFIIFGWLFFWFLIAAKRRPCVNKDCKRKLNRKQKVCPDCDTIQKEKNPPVAAKKKAKKATTKKKASSDKKTETKKKGKTKKSESSSEKKTKKAGSKKSSSKKK